MVKSKVDCHSFFHKDQNVAYKKILVIQGCIQRSFDTAQPVWDPKFLSQINKKLKILE